MSITPEINTNPQQQLVLQRIYTKESTFMSPQAPAVFKATWKPEIKLELKVQHNKLEDNYYEVELLTKVTATNSEQEAFTINVKQAGIFTIDGFEPDALNYMLGSYCPNMLFPYIREHVSDQVVRAGFPQLLLIPINFDAVYAQKQESAKTPADKKNKWHTDVETVH